MTIDRAKQAHLWVRDEHDWYVEPYECSLALFDHVTFSGSIWDPACGIGRIVKSALLSGLDCFGSDIIARSSTCSIECDFFDSRKILPYENIISNPPFGRAEEFVLRSLSLVPVGGHVAMILPLVWMAGFSSKRDWLPRSPLQTVLPISPRPSMPPGAVIAAGEKPGNGTKDFAWFVWKKGTSDTPRIDFLHTKPYAHAARILEREERCERKQVA